MFYCNLAGIILSLLIFQLETLLTDCYLPIDTRGAVVLNTGTLPDD